MPVRATILVRGDVQGVGYRLLVQRTASRCGVVGQVRNLDDGSVEVISEGERGAISKLKRGIWVRSGPIYVDGMSVSYSAPTGEFNRFRIIRPRMSPGELEIVERLDIGLMAMEKLSSKQDGTTAAVKHLGKKQDKTLGAVKAMDSHTSGNFRRLNSGISGHFGRIDGKYGRFGKTLKGMAGDMKGIRNDLRRALRSSGNKRKKSKGGKLKGNKKMKMARRKPAGK